MVDESTGMAVVNYLRSLGYDVLAVAETISQAADSDVLARASSEGRILVTNDKDFGELAFRVGQVHQGVLLLRLQDESPTNCVRVRTYPAGPLDFIISVEANLSCFNLAVPIVSLRAISQKEEKDRKQ